MYVCMYVPQPVWCGLQRSRRIAHAPFSAAAVEHNKVQHSTSSSSIHELYTSSGPAHRATSLFFSFPGQDCTYVHFYTFRLLSPVPSVFFKGRRRIPRCWEVYSSASCKEIDRQCPPPPHLHNLMVKSRHGTGLPKSPSTCPLCTTPSKRDEGKW
jgi:hypothetical protein